MTARVQFPMYRKMNCNFRKQFVEVFGYISQTFNECFRDIDVCYFAYLNKRATTLFNWKTTYQISRKFFYLSRENRRFCENGWKFPLRVIKTEKYRQ
jgi:hypothetical protein